MRAVTKRTIGGIVVALAGIGALALMVEWAKPMRPLLGPGAEPAPITVYMDATSDPAVCWVVNPGEGNLIRVECDGAGGPLDQVRRRLDDQLGAGRWRFEGERASRARAF